MIRNDRPIEYQMTKRMFNSILDGKGEEIKNNPYAYVLNIVNEQFGLRGKVERILIYSE